MPANQIIANDQDTRVRAKLNLIRQYMETTIFELTATSEKKDKEIRYLKETLQIVQQQEAGNHQLINKLLGELGKLKSDIEWYKLIYEKKKSPFNS